MPLSKEDLKNIKNLIDSGNDLISIRIEKFKLYAQKKFDHVDERLDKLEHKIDQLLKSRLEKLESKVYKV